MKTMIHQPEHVALHVRIFSQAELRTLMMVSVIVGILFNLFR
jgi:hypothetical protein